jgi:hypothetical protein
MGADWVNAYAAWVSAIGTWIGVVVVIVSVLILRTQLRDTRSTIRSASAQGSYALWVGVDQFFVEYPELKPFFYEAKSLEGPIDENLKRRVESAAEMMSDAMANVFHQMPHFTPEEAEAYGNFLKEQYQTQPALKQFIDETARWYPNSFVRFLRSEISWLINEAPVPRYPANTTLQPPSRAQR